MVDCRENADIVLVVFALDARETQDVGAYIADVLAVPTKPTWAIVGNKVDLLEMGGLDLSTVNALAKTHGVPLYFTSAKDNTNVQEVFLDLVRKRIKLTCDEDLKTGKPIAR